MLASVNLLANSLGERTDCPLIFMLKLASCNEVCAHDKGQRGNAQSKAHKFEATKENKLVLHTDTHTRTHAQKSSQDAHLGVSAGNTAQLVHVHVHVATKA